MASVHPQRKAWEGNEECVILPPLPLPLLMTGCQPHINAVPAEVLSVIFCFLSEAAVFCCNAVCQKWRQSCEEFVYKHNERKETFIANRKSWWHWKHCTYTLHNINTPYDHVSHYRVCGPYVLTSCSLHTRAHVSIHSLELGVRVTSFPGSCTCFDLKAPVLVIGHATGIRCYDATRFPTYPPVYLWSQPTSRVTNVHIVLTEERGEAVPILLSFHADGMGRRWKFDGSGGEVLFDLHQGLQSVHDASPHFTVAGKYAVITGSTDPESWLCLKQPKLTARVTAAYTKWELDRDIPRATTVTAFHNSDFQFCVQHLRDGPGGQPPTIVLDQTLKISLHQYVATVLCVSGSIDDGCLNVIIGGYDGSVHFYHFTVTLPSEAHSPLVVGGAWSSPSSNEAGNTTLTLQNANIQVVRHFPLPYHKHPITDIWVDDDKVLVCDSWSCVSVWEIKYEQPRIQNSVVQCTTRNTPTSTTNEPNNTNTSLSDDSLQTTILSEGSGSHQSNSSATTHITVVSTLDRRGVFTCSSHNRNIPLPICAPCPLFAINSEQYVVPYAARMGTYGYMCKMSVNGDRLLVGPQSVTHLLQMFTFGGQRPAAFLRGVRGTSFELWWMSALFVGYNVVVVLVTISVGILVTSSTAKAASEPPSVPAPPSNAFITIASLGVPRTSVITLPPTIVAIGWIAVFGWYLHSSSSVICSGVLFWGCLLCLLLIGSELFVTSTLGYSLGLLVVFVVYAVTCYLRIHYACYTLSNVYQTGFFSKDKINWFRKVPPPFTNLSFMSKAVGWYRQAGFHRLLAVFCYDIIYFAMLATIVTISTETAAPPSAPSSSPTAMDVSTSPFWYYVLLPIYFIAFAVCVFLLARLFWKVVKRHEAVPSVRFIIISVYLQVATGLFFMFIALWLERPIAVAACVSCIACVQVVIISLAVWRYQLQRHINI